MPAATLSFTYSGANTNLFDTVGVRTLNLTGTNTGANTFAIQLTDQTANATNLTKAGTGTWVVTNNANSFSGVTSVNGGILRVLSTSPNVLGTTTGGTIVNSLGTLELNGNFTLPAEPIQITGGGYAGVGALYATGSVVVPGRIGMGGSAAIGASAGSTLTLNGTMHKDFNNTTLTFVGGGDVTVNSPIGNASDDYTLSPLTGRLYAVGAGVPALFGTNAEIAAVVGGTVPTNTANLTGALNFGPQGTGDAAITTFFGGTNPGTQNFTATFDGILTVVTGGTYSFTATINDDGAAVWLDRDQDNVFETAGGAGNELLQSVGNGNTAVASVSLAPGNYRLVYAVRDTGGGASLVGRLQGPTAIGQTNGTLLPIVNPTATTTGTNNVVVNSTGTVTFTAANTYNGTTTVNNGVLLLSGAAATLGSSAGGTNVESGATLALEGGVIVAGETLTINGLGAPGQLGALANVSGTNTITASSSIIARPVSLGEVRLATLANQLNVDAAINLNSSKLSVDGAGSTTINGNITGTGATVGTPPTAGVSNVFADVAEASGFTLALENNNIPGGVSGAANYPYTVTNTGSIGAFDRIAYYVELEGGAEAATRRFVWISMDPFTNNIAQIGVPEQAVAANQWSFQQVVSNMNVASNVPTGTGGGQVVQGTAIGSGNIEIWPSNYSQGNTLNIPNASSVGTNAGYDFGDGGFSTADGHGSFQFHNYDVDGAGPGTAGQTLFSYSQWKAANPGLGIGNSPIGAGSGFDYTFVNNLTSYTTLKRLSILVREVNPSYRQTDNSLMKLGVGTLTLAGTNTYNGVTNVKVPTSMLITMPRWTTAWIPYARISRPAARSSCLMSSVMWTQLSVSGGYAVICEMSYGRYFEPSVVSPPKEQYRNERNRRFYQTLLEQHAPIWQSVPGTRPMPSRTPPSRYIASGRPRNDPRVMCRPMPYAAISATMDLLLHTTTVSHRSRLSSL